MSLAEKRAAIDPEHAQLSIQRQCELIGLNRASYYTRSAPDLPGAETASNLELMRVMDELYTRCPFYGSRKLRKQLNRMGYPVNRKRVQRLMARRGIESVAPKPNTSRSAPDHEVYPYRLRGLTIDRPNQVWCSDISSIRLRHGFVYLTAMMDWSSRYVLSWEVSVTMEDGFCVSALERAMRRHGMPEIFNSDQGSQYTGKAFTGVLKDANVIISMDGQGRCTDNIFIERLWRSVKYEEVYLKEYDSVAELKQALTRYFAFYNNERPHQSFEGQTPAEAYYGQPVSMAA